MARRTEEEYPEGSRRAEYAPEPDTSETSDALGAFGLFGVAAAMGVCCIAVPAILAGALTLGAVVGVAPWLLGGGAVAAAGWGVHRLVRGDADEDEEACCPPGEEP